MISPERAEIQNGSGNGPLSSPFFASVSRKPARKVLSWPAPKQPQLFEDDMAALRRDLAAHAEKQRAAQTRKAYESDWKNFEQFCHLAGCESLPALPMNVMLYLAYQARLGLSIATITRRLAAITAAHKRIGHPTPCNADVGLVLADLRRELGAGGKPKTPVSPENLKAMLGTVVGSGARECLYRAILVTGFASGMRRSELAALNLCDVTFAPLGLVIRILRSKTDQQGKGREVGVQHGENADTCPVRVLEMWLRARGDWAGPLFPRVLLNDKITDTRLSPMAIARVVKRTAKRAGLDSKLYAGHSLRSGCATSAAAAGADILAIKQRLGHASIRTTEKYVRHGSVFACNPLKGVL